MAEEQQQQTEKASEAAAQTPAEEQKPKKELWKAVYVGSGTFIISKPKRNPKKLRESRLHNPKRRMR